MNYTDYVKKLQEQIKQNLLGYSKLVSGTDFTRIINDALNKGYVAINPQVGSKQLATGLARQIQQYLNATLKDLDKNIPQIGLGKANAPAHPGDIAQTIRHQLVVKSNEEFLQAKKLTDAQALKDASAAKRLVAQQAAAAKKVSIAPVLTQIQQDEKAVLDAQRELKAQQRLEKAKADLAKANAQTVRPLARQAQKLAKLLDPEIGDINLIAGEYNAASSAKDTGKVHTIKSISDELRKKKGITVQTQETRDLYTPIIADAFKVKPGDVTESQRELYSSLHEMGHAVDTNKMTQEQRLKSLADEATFRANGTATQAQHMDRPRELAANEYAKQILQNAVNQGVDLGVPSGLTPHVPPTPAFGVTSNATTRLPPNASLQAKVAASTQVLSEQVAQQAVKQAQDQINQLARNAGQKPSTQTPSWMSTKQSPWEKEVALGKTWNNQPNQIPVPPAPKVNPMQVQADWAAAIKEQTARNFQSNPRYSAVWGKLQEGDLLNKTNFANVGNIRSINTEQNRNVGYISSQYKDTATGMNMSNKVFFNPQTGQVLTDFSNRFSTLTQRIARNTKEFIGWTAAVTLVYLPLQKLGQLMQDTIDQEARLADVAIVMQLSQKGLNQVFFDAADIARKTGESLTGVVEGYAMAAQASAGYRDEVERVVVTNKLLYDSIVLAKMSGMSQAEATDTLVASLTQMNIPLDQGMTLLDKWQATARAANVPVATLASTFAIVGQAATDAGLSIEELNAITAIVATAQITSAKETGNAMRGIIAGYTTQGSQEVLRQFGVSVKDTEGNMRGLLDVYSQVAAMIQSGAINESQKNRIAMAMTGGNRGMSRVTSLLLGMGNINDIVTAQANPQGQAERAIQFELTTTQAKITNLGTSFSELARTLGTEGGLLPTFKALTEALTWLVDGFTAISSVMGASTLTAVSLAIAYKSLFSTIGQGSVLATMASMAGGIAGRLATNPAGKSFTSEGWQTNKQVATNTAMGGVLANPNRTLWSTGIVAGAAGAGIPAVMNALGGNSRAAYANIGGGIAGGILGALTLNPALVAIGAAIGSSAGESMLNIWDSRFGGKGGANIGTLIPAGISPESDQTKADALKAAADIAEAEKNKLSKNEILQKGIQGLAGRLTPQEIAAIPGFRGTAGPGLTEQQLFDAVAKAFPGEYAKLIADYNTKVAGASSVGRVDVNSPFVKLSGDIASALAEPLRLANVNAKTGLQAAYYSPTKNISRTEYQRQTELLGTGNTNVSNTLAALYKGAGAFDKISSYNLDPTKFTNWADTLKYITETVMGLTADQLGELQSMTSEITDLETKIAEAKKQGRVGPELDAMIAKENALKTNFGPEFKLKAEQFALANAKPPSITDLKFQSQKEFDLAKDGADKIQKIQIDVMTNTYDQLAQVQTNLAEKVLVKIGDVWVEVNGRSADSLQKALEDVRKESMNFNPNLGISGITATPDQLKQAEAAYPKLIADLEKNFGPYGWKKNEELQIMKVTNPNGGPDTFKLAFVDMAILSGLLQEISDNTKDIQGMYNLPSGAEFYVPYQAAEMSWKSQQGTGTGALGELYRILQSGIASPALDANTQAIRENTQKLGAQESLNRFTRNGVDAATTEKLTAQDYLKRFTRNGTDAITPYDSGGLGDRGVAQAINIPPIKTQINLTTNSDVTLTIDGNVLAKILSTKLGQLIAQTGTTFGVTLNQFVGSQ